MFDSMSSSSSSSSFSGSVIPGTQSRLSLADFELLKLIGKGRSGPVYLARDWISREEVAIKVIKKGEGHEDNILNGQEIQRDLSGCSFVLPLWGSWHDEENFYLVTRYLGGHDLAINLAVKTRFSEERARFHTAELLIALEQMKAHMVLHRDLKPANVVFTSSGHIRVIDLGLATRLKASTVTHVNFIADPNALSGSFKFNDPDYTSAEQVGTPHYMSPDVHLGRPYSFEADLHSLGVVLYSMLTGRLPFGDGAQSRDEILEAVLCEQLTFQPEDAVSSEARDLLSQLLRRDSKKPALLEDIMCHPWFYPIRWDQMRAHAISPRWKPHSTPLPKSTSMCTITEGLPCLPDPYPDFTYVSPEFLALRSREKSIWRKIGALFSGPGDQSPNPVTPPASPAQSVSTPDISPDVSVLSPPPNIPLPPLPMRKTADPVLLAMLSCPSPPQSHSPGRGGVLPPLIIRQKLAQRAPPSVKERHIREDIPRTPEVTITPPDSEDEIQEVESRASPLRSPFTEILDQHLLSPMDADRPTFNPVKVGPRIKLSAPPKRTRRAQKENAVVDGSTVTPPQAPQSQPLVGPKFTVALHPAITSKPVVSRSPPIAVFMIPPKMTPLPIVPPNPSPIRTPPQATLKSKTMAKPSSRTSPPKSAPPKVKPAPKVSSKDPISKQRQVTLRRRNSVVTRSPASLPSIRSPDFTNAREGTYPRVLVREKTLSHPALAFADAKERPNDYPRPPQLTQVKSASLNEPSILSPPISRPGLQEAQKNVAIVPVDFTRSSSKDAQVSSLSVPDSPALVTSGPCDNHLIMSPQTGSNDWRSFFARISTALRGIFSWVRFRGAPTLNRL